MEYKRRSRYFQHLFIFILPPLLECNKSRAISIYNDNNWHNSDLKWNPHVPGCLSRTEGSPPSPPPPPTKPSAAEFMVFLSFGSAACQSSHCKHISGCRELTTEESYACRDLLEDGDIMSDNNKGPVFASVRRAAYICTQIFDRRWSSSTFSGAPVENWNCSCFPQWLLLLHLMTEIWVCGAIFCCVTWDHGKTKAGICAVSLNISRELTEQLLLNSCLSHVINMMCSNNFLTSQLLNHTKIHLQTRRWLVCLYDEF